jgi:hypothetical protein
MKHQFRLLDHRVADALTIVFASPCFECTGSPEDPRHPMAREYGEPLGKQASGADIKAFLDNLHETK